MMGLAAQCLQRTRFIIGAAGHPSHSTFFTCTGQKGEKAVTTICNIN
jgi:hypothetical protein